MQTLRIVNHILFALFFLSYLYQFIYIPVRWFAKKKKKAPNPPTQPGINRYAVLICARNEEIVIADLIDSIRRQTYDPEKITVFVLADNCTDGTARTAKEAGAVVYERHDLHKIGKGYAMTELFRFLKRDYPEGFDGYFVFDADNVLKADYVENMDRTFCQGYDAVTGYRNSKNYADNWISAGYALWFLRESEYLNYPRSVLGTSCAVSGTGFLFGRKIAEELDGWPFHLLTEDIEFSVYHACKKKKIGYCREAELFDEQPVKFLQSERQRMRWARGYLQVFRHYGLKLFRGIFSGNFACYDMAMAIMPAYVLSVLSIVLNLGLGIWGAIIGDDVMIAVRSILQFVGSLYLSFFIVAIITTITEWKHLHASAFKKILYAFTSPLFMATYLPAAFAALFVNPSWKPIHHTVSVEKIRLKNEKGTLQDIAPDR